MRSCWVAVVALASPPTAPKSRGVVVDALGPPFGATAVEAHLVKVECKAWMTDDLTYREGTERDYGHDLLKAPHDGRIFFAGTETAPARRDASPAAKKAPAHCEQT